MKKQLSLTLLTLSIFSLNFLPAQAATKKSQSDRTPSTENAILDDGQWCVEVPWMGFFCWDL